MTWDEIFTAYYSQFRADSDVPSSTDAEYTVGLRMANEAIKYWENYDGTLWNELFDTNNGDGTGAQTIVSGQDKYTAPTNFKKAGGFVRVYDTDGNMRAHFPIVDAQDAQFYTDTKSYCYFTGDPKNGYTLHLNPTPTDDINDMTFDYDYYKTATLLTTGTSVPEMSNPYFIVHRILANEFRAARNPYYTSANADALNAIKVMQIDNNSGSWANPPQFNDTSGTVWGK